MDFENIWCWIIPLLVGAICGYLGYLWGKSKGVTIIENEDELKALKEKNDKLHADLTACNHKVIDLENSISVSKSIRGNTKPKKESKPKKFKEKNTGSTTNLEVNSLTATTPANAFDAERAKLEYGKRVKLNDLKVVEGIGPKIEGLFHDSGIRTWQALAEATQEKCLEILKSGGDRYKLHDPASWPLQAKMAFESEWKKLATWQEDHKGGKL